MAGMKQIPEIILVKKKIEKIKKKKKKRDFKLKRLEIEKYDENKLKSKNENQAEQNRAKEFEEFLDDIEENPDMRGYINIYKVTF